MDVSPNLTSHFSCFLKFSLFAPKTYNAMAPIYPFKLFCDSWKVSKCATYIGILTGVTYKKLVADCLQPFISVLLQSVYFPDS